MPAPQFGAIDIVVNLRTSKEFSGGAVASDSSFQDKVRQSSNIRQGVEVEEYMGMMDEAGISRSILCAVRCGDLRVKGSTELKYERVITGKRLSVPQTWAWTPPAQSAALLLGSWKSVTRFESLEWQAL